jgi:hypothetical protein
VPGEREGGEGAEGAEGAEGVPSGWLLQKTVNGVVDAFRTAGPARALARSGAQPAGESLGDHDVVGPEVMDVRVPEAEER